MGLVDKIFAEFIEANGFTAGADFKKKTRFYLSPSGIKLSREEITGSEEFAGFVDGICGNKNRYERQGREKTFAVEVKTEDFLGAGLDKLKENDKSRATDLVRQALSQTSLSYVDQYRLGSTLKSHLRERREDY
jgi:hypothetical protein